MPAPAPGRSGRCHGLRPDAAGQQLHGCPCRRMALQYSIPKMLLGVCSKSAAPGHNVSAAAARAAAKGRAAFSWLRSAAGNAALHSAAAAACRAGSGFRHRTQGYRTPARPADVPRQRQTVLRWRWHRRRQRHHQVRPGSQRRAHPHSFRQDGYPTALHNAGAHAHRDGTGPRCRSMRSCNAWPLWNGSYSAMMPTKFISSTPDSLQILFAYAEKSLAMFSASLYNKFV